MAQINKNGGNTKRKSTVPLTGVQRRGSMHPAAMLPRRAKSAAVTIEKHATKPETDMHTRWFLKHGMEMAAYGQKRLKLIWIFQHVCEC